MNSVEDQDQVIAALAQASQNSGGSGLVPDGMIVSRGTLDDVPVAPAIERRRLAVGAVLDQHLVGLDFQIRAVMIEQLVNCL